MSPRSPRAPNPLIPLGITLFGCFFAIGAMIWRDVASASLGIVVMAISWLIHLSAQGRHSRANRPKKRRRSRDRSSGDSGGWFSGGGDSQASGDSCSSGDSGGGGDCGGGGD